MVPAGAFFQEGEFRAGVEGGLEGGLEGGAVSLAGGDFFCEDDPGGPAGFLVCIHGQGAGEEEAQHGEGRHGEAQSRGPPEQVDAGADPDRVEKQQEKQGTGEKAGVIVPEKEGLKQPGLGLWLDGVGAPTAGKGQILLEIRVVWNPFFRPAVVQDGFAQVPEPEIGISQIIEQLAVFDAPLPHDALKGERRLAEKLPGFLRLGFQELVSLAERVFPVTVQAPQEALVRAHGLEGDDECQKPQEKGKYTTNG